MLGWETSKIPALAADGTNLYMAWRNGTDNRISWSVLAGETWLAPRVLLDRRTDNGLALSASTTGNLVMTWVGANGDPHIWWSPYRDGRWETQQAFSDRQANTGLRVDLA
ncbi:hypothetical protein [Streptosporangium roseum]|uniref:hypothetical protein n=1 Tax=Streptosporangium roseum TaxID=2001 RepID=UPI0004CD769E|nr:hypothetical protein [Streptosporangium roseum]